jgi:tetratricopeptide (TPR) repeat protein
MKRFAEAMRKLSSGLSRVLLVAGFCAGQATLAASVSYPPHSSAAQQSRSPQRSVPSSKTSAVEKDELVLFEAGQAELDQGHYDEAIRIYNKLLVLAARDRKTLATVHVKIGSVFVARRRFDRASAEFQQATTLDPEYAVAHNNLGEARGELRQYNLALEAFNRAVAVDPKLSRARYNIGITYGRLGNLKYSEFVFRLLVRDRPEYDLGYDGLAVTLSRAGRAREALMFHQKAISLNPREPSYYYNLALSYLIVGETEKALEQQKILRELAPEVANQLASVIIKKQMR